MFILAALGTRLGVLPPEATNALVAAADCVDLGQPAALPGRWAQSRRGRRDGPGYGSS